MKPTARLGLLAFCIAAGCSEKEPTPPPKPVAVVPRPAPAAVKPAPPPAPVAPPSSTGAPATAQPQAREQPMDLNSLDSVLQDYANATGRVPKTFQEMVHLKLIPRVPQPPAGKQWVIDPVAICIKEK